MHEANAGWFAISVLHLTGALNAKTNVGSTKVDDLRHKPPDYVSCECVLSQLPGTCSGSR